MSNAAAVQEPTMEEILASIRRIVSDDEPEAATAESETVLDLTDDMMDPAPTPAAIEAVREVVLEDDPSAEEADIAMAAQEATRSGTSASPVAEATTPEDLMSAGASTAVASAFGNLNHLVMSQNARTLDDIVTEMMRPMLREWLDDNLPPLVERLVKEEIQRISRAQ